MKDLRPQRRSEPRVERRKAQVEINLLADVETTGRRRRGCSLPFFGGVFMVAIEALRIVTG
jgi:hypothetical protein